MSFAKHQEHGQYRRITLSHIHQISSRKIYIRQSVVIDKCWKHCGKRTSKRTLITNNLKKLSAADASKCVFMRAMVNTVDLRKIYVRHHNSCPWTKVKRSISSNNTCIFPRVSRWCCIGVDKLWICSLIIEVTRKLKRC